MWLFQHFSIATGKAAGAKSIVKHFYTLTCAPKLKDIDEKKKSGKGLATVSE